MSDSAVSRFLGEKDFYSALGLTQDFTEKQLRTAYRTYATMLHPDRCKDSRAAQAFSSLGHMRETLSDPDKRGAYDATLRFRMTATHSEPRRFRSCSRLRDFMIFVFVCFAGIYLFSGVPKATVPFRKQDLEAVVKFEDGGADDIMMWTDPGRHRFFVPRGWMDGDVNARNAVSRMADIVYWDRVKERCRQEQNGVGARPNCGKLYSR